MDYLKTAAESQAYMADKQNKGIGQYKDRPGYFWGGLVGGAILGALVNKVQGKDWKRGAMWGGITGGLGSAFVGSGSTAAGTGWLDKMAPGITKSIFTMGSGNPALFGSTLGAAGAWMAGDPKYDAEKWERKKREEEAKRRKEQEEAYKYWHTNPWATGGAVNARPGYPGGGSATLEYTDPDLYTPTGEGGGPSSNPIRQIPLGPEGSFADEFEDLDMASASHPMDEWNQMYENYLSQGGSPMPLPDFIEMMTSEGDFTPDYGARGGYKTRPGYADAGPVDMPYDPEEEDKTYWERIIEKLRASEMLNTPNRVGRTAIDEWEQSEFNTAKWLQKVPVLRGIMDREIEAAAHKRPMAFRAEGGRVGMYGGGTGDLDMTSGGASNGPGTGTSDDIPAMLSDGEFVVTANAVKNLGGGDRMVGAQRMYRMMNQLDPNSQTPAEMSGIGYA